MGLGATTIQAEPAGMQYIRTSRIPNPESRLLTPNP